MSVLIDDRSQPTPTALDEATLLRVARQLASTEARWRPYVVHDPAERRPVRLVVTDTYEAWIIGWTEGQRVDLHDHGDAAGALVVAEGTLTETILDDGELRVRDLHAGTEVGLPSGLVHEVVATSAAPTTSIHVYSPPLTTMRFYDERTGARVRTDEFADHAEADTETSAIARHLDRARERLQRVRPENLADEVASGALVVDIRPEFDRVREGELPGAVIIERIHLEWRLDPTSPDRLADASEDRRIVIVCNEGYASSLAAVTLQDLGLVAATDLVGGFRAWRLEVGSD